MMVQVQNFYNNPDLELPPLELTFRDYVLSLTERRNMESYKQAQAYWRERIPTLAPGPRMPVLGENAVGAPVSKPMDGQLCPEKWKRLKDYGTKNRPFAHEHPARRLLRGAAPLELGKGFLPEPHPVQPAAAASADR